MPKDSFPYQPKPSKKRLYMTLAGLAAGLVGVYTAYDSEAVMEILTDVIDLLMPAEEAVPEGQ